MARIILRLRSAQAQISTNFFFAPFATFREKIFNHLGHNENLCKGISLLILIRLCPPLIFYLLFNVTNSLAQNKTVDSLNVLLKNAKHDTTRLNILNRFIENENDNKVWQPYNGQMKIISEKLAKSNDAQLKLKGMKGLADAFINEGYLCNNQGQIKETLDFFGRSIEILQKIGDKEGIANTLNNIGFIYNIQGQIKEALDYYKKSLKIREIIGDNEGISTSLNNIGMIYNNQGQIKEALDYYVRSLKIHEEFGNKEGIATSFNNIGMIYNNQGQIKEALDYYGRSLKIREEIGDQKGIASCLNNIGGIYNSQGQTKEALKYFGRSLKIWEKIGVKQGIASCLNNIGKIYLKQKDYLQALSYSDSSLTLAKKIGYPENIRNAAKLYSDIYKATGDYKSGWEMYEFYIQMRDSVKNKENEKAAIRQQTKYEFEKALIVKEQEEKEKKRQVAVAVGRRNKLQYTAIFMGLLVLFGGVFMLGKFHLPVRVVEISVFMSFLLLFEFLLVFLDPYLDQLTGGVPLLKLLVNAVIAGIIFPVHGFFEDLMKKRLMKKKKDDTNFHELFLCVPCAFA